MIHDHGRRPDGRSRWRRAALLSALVTSLSLASGPALAAPAPSGEPEVPALRWADCGDGFLCSRAWVPLDYTHPDGAHISLALIRLPATDQAQRIGSLLTNFGGPGTEGIERVRTGARALPAAVRARFDVIGVDPRGVGASSPIRCFPDAAAQEQFLSDVPLFPRFPFGHRQQAAYITAMDRLGDACLRRNAAIMRHMSTVNVARDLDLLRRALGDDALTFYGASYGTYLGIVYANLYPDRVRALVLDAVVNPGAWAAGDSFDTPLFLRQGSDAGAAATMQQFLRRCDDAGARCAFGGHAAAKFTQLLAWAKQAPIIVSTPDGPLPVSYPDLVGLTLASLHEPDTWADLGDTLQALYDAGASGAARQRPGPVPALLTRTAAPGNAPQGYDNEFEALLGVACTDGVEPRQPSGWPRAAAQADERFGPFGSPWAWLSEACATWPATDPDRYRGPFTARPAAPVLLVGTRFDPALAYSNATLVDRELPNNRLLTLNGWGHVALGRSTCIQQHVAAYLITVQPPPVGTTCPPDRRPFEPAGAPEGAIRHG